MVKTLLKKLPKKIKLGHLNYTITNDKKSFDDFGVKVQDLDAMGYTDVEQVALHIKNDLALGSEQETSLHEVCHAIYHMMGLIETVGYEKEETIVGAFGTALLMVIKDNPGFIEYLQQKG